MDEGIGLMREEALAEITARAGAREQHPGTMSETVVARRPQAGAPARPPKLITFSRGHRTYNNFEYIVEVEFIAAHVPAARLGQILEIDPIRPHH